MKRILYSSLAVISALFLILSCAKENNEFEPINEGGIKVTLNIGKASLKPSTKTEIVGTTPYWSVGDQIGVSNGTTSNALFSTGIAARALIASFSGTVESAGDYYAYYPYTTNGVGNVSGNYGAKVDLPANQYPTATSFDGSADIMLSTQFTVTETTPTVNNLEFARLGAVVKIVLIDSESIMSSQHPSTVSMTADTPLAGRVLVNMQEQSMGDPYYNQSNTVTANYTAGTKYEINGTNATYLIVIPQTLAAGSTLTIAASTEGYSIEKDITVPVGGIVFEAGKITTLNITLTSSHISASSGLALPFNDNFSWQNTTKTDGLNFGTTPAIPSAKYSAFDWIYGGGESGVIRMSKSSGTGYLTTVDLDLSSAFYVHINSKYWSDSDATHLFVSVDDGAAEEITLTGDYADYYVNFPAATNKSKVKVTTTTNKRAYFKAFDIISGTYVFPPVINVTSSNPMNVANTASSQTITYSISNPTAATLTAALQDPLDTWISNIDYSTDGEVTFDVAAQGSGDPARSAVIVLSYTGAPDVEVTVNQAAGAGGGKTEYTATLTISSGVTANTTLTDDKGKEWTVTAVTTSWTSNSSYIQIGTNSKAATSLTLSSSDFGSVDIKEVHVWAGAKASSGVCSTISIDGHLLATSAELTNTVSSGSGEGTELAANNTSDYSGDIDIVISRASSANGAIYFKKLTVVYEE